MANTIEYGQGAVNNTIGWGQGAKVGSSFSNTLSTRFDGIDDFVDITSTGLSLGNDWSVSAWINTNDKSLDGAAFRGWFSTGGYNTATKFKFSVRSDNGYVAVWEGNGQVIVGNSNIVDNNWHNVIVTKTASEISLFVDGTQQSTVSNSETWSFDDIYLGAGGRSTGVTNAGMWNGAIDEVSVFNTTLSQSDVTAIYNSGVPASLDTYNPLLWYRMGDSDTFPILTDNGSEGNNGTMTNMTSGNIVSDVPT